MNELNQKLGRYQLLEKIGSGGMADIYRAKFSGVAGFEKTVAIKKILPYWSSNQEFIDMLVEEAKILVQLSHPNIVQVFELNREGGDHFIVMEFVDGVDLRTLTNRVTSIGQVFPVDLTLYLLLQIGAGLQYAHDKKDRQHKPLGIVHRDISPQNILLSSDGEVKIADFGIARILGRTAETVTGTLKGKFSYMSPEQALGKKVDLQSDIYALGILLYELLSGERLFKGSNDLETLDAVRNGVITFSPSAESRIAPELKAIILTALKKDPAGRYGSVVQFSRALDDWRVRAGFHADADDLKRFLSGIIPEKFQHSLASGETTLKHAATVVVAPRKTRILSSSPVVLPVASKRSPPTFRRVGIARHPLAFGVIVLLVVAGLFFVAVGIRERTVKLPRETISVGTLASPSPAPVLPSSVPVESAVKQPDPIPTTPTHYEATLNVRSVPPDSLITLSHDGQSESFKGVASFKGFLVKPETFLVSVKHEGYSPASQKITLSPENRSHKSEVVLAELRFGGLSVAARPWGKVFLKDIVSGAETPFANEKVPVGEHDVSVVFPPTSRKVSAAVTIREGTTTRCQAIFGSDPVIKCN